MNRWSTVDEIIRDKSWLFYLLFKLVSPTIRDIYYLAAAYSYMRHLDDIVDESGLPPLEIQGILAREKRLILDLYAERQITPRNEYEKLLADFVKYDLECGTPLRDAFLETLDTLFFDVRRVGRLCTCEQLDAYTRRMASSFVRFMLHFLKIPDVAYEELIRVSTAACQAYMLRDLREDLKRGLVNIDIESIRKYGINLDNISGENVQSWIRSRAIHIVSELSLIGKLMKYPFSTRDKIVFLLFIEPRKYVLQRLRKNNFIPFGEYTLSAADVMRIAYRMGKHFVVERHCHA